MTSLRDKLITATLDEIKGIADGSIKPEGRTRKTIERILKENYNGDLDKYLKTSRKNLESIATRYEPKWYDNLSNLFLSMLKKYFSSIDYFIRDGDEIIQLHRDISKKKTKGSITVPNEIADIYKKHPVFVTCPHYSHHDHLLSLSPFYLADLLEFQTRAGTNLKFPIISNILSFRNIYWANRDKLMKANRDKYDEHYASDFALYEHFSMLLANSGDSSNILTYFNQGRIRTGKLNETKEERKQLEKMLRERKSEPFKNEEGIWLDPMSIEPVPKVNPWMFLNIIEWKLLNPDLELYISPLSISYTVVNEARQISEGKVKKTKDKREIGIHMLKTANKGKNIASKKYVVLNKPLPFDYFIDIDIRDIDPSRFTDLYKVANNFVKNVSNYIASGMIIPPETLFSAVAYKTYYDRGKKDLKLPSADEMYDEFVKQKRHLGNRLPAEFNEIEMDKKTFVEFYDKTKEFCVQDKRVNEEGKMNIRLTGYYYDFARHALLHK